jgi:hypothetical protein
MDDETGKPHVTVCNKKGCNAFITWAKSVTGKTVAVDSAEDGKPLENLKGTGAGGLQPTGTADEKGTPMVRNVAPGKGRWSCHWATCVHQEARRPQKAQAS